MFLYFFCTCGTQIFQIVQKMPFKKVQINMTPPQVVNCDHYDNAVLVDPSTALLSRLLIG